MSDLPEYDIREALAFQSIMSIRIYDVLLAILSNSNIATANNLKELHKQGRTLSSSPRLMEGSLEEND